MSVSIFPIPVQAVEDNSDTKRSNELLEKQILELKLNNEYNSRKIDEQLTHEDIEED